MRMQRSGAAIFCEICGATSVHLENVDPPTLFVSRAHVRLLNISNK